MAHAAAFGRRRDAGQFTRGLPHWYLQFNQNFFYGSLLASPSRSTGITITEIPAMGSGHPSDGTLAFGRDTPYRQIPLSFRVRAGIGYAHDRRLTKATNSFRLFARRGELHDDLARLHRSDLHDRLVQTDPRSKKSAATSLQRLPRSSAPRFSLPHVADN